MKPPAHITVGPYRLAIECEVLESDDLYGDFDLSLQRLRYADGMEPTAVAETIIHESLHAMLQVAGLTVSKALAKHEEQIAGSLAPVLLKFIVDNPTLISYLKKAVK